MHFHIRKTIRYFCSYRSPAPCQNEYKFTSLATLLEIDRADLVNIINNEKLDLGNSCAEVMEKNVHYLLNSGFDKSYIKKHIRLINMPSSSLKNKLQICEECGCFKHEIGSVILNFSKIIKKPISTLREHAILPADSNLTHQILKYTGCWKEDHQIPSGDKKDTLRNIYGQVYKLYLEQEMPTILQRCEFELSFKRFSFPSIRNFQINVDFMQNNFQHEIQKGHKSLLFSDSLCDILELKQIPDLEKLVVKQPQVSGVPVDVVKRIFNICEKYQVDFSLLIANDCKIFSLNTNEFESRVCHCVNSEELKCFKNHPRISQLIVHYNIAQERLRILRKLDLKCFSLTLLTVQENVFWRHVKKDIDVLISNDAAILLHNELKKPMLEIKKQLSKHAFYYYIPVFKIMSNVDLLRNRGFSNEEIFINIQILLYPSDTIEKMLSKIINGNIADQNESQPVLDRKHYLSIALYYIDKNQESVFSDRPMISNEDFKVEENETLLNMEEDENLLTKV